MILHIYTIDEDIEVNEDGSFELPHRPYKASELKKIAREVNKAIREKEFEYNFED